MSTSVKHSIQAGGNEASFIADLQRVRYEYDMRSKHPSNDDDSEERATDEVRDRRSAHLARIKKDIHSSI